MNIYFYLSELDKLEDRNMNKRIKIKSAGILIALFVIFQCFAFASATMTRENREDSPVLFEKKENKLLVNEEKTTIFENIKTELVEKRTRTSKSFILEDGTRVTDLYTTPVHYLDENGKWQEIDLTITRSSNLVFEYENTKNSFQTYFGRASEPKVAVEYEDNYLTFAPVNNQFGNGNLNSPSTTKVEENRLVYMNFIDGADLRYSVGRKTIKEDIIINEYKGVNTFKFIVENSNGAWVEKDNTYIFVSNGEEIFRFLDLYMKDANGIESNAVSISMVKVGNAHLLTVEADRDWLEDSARAYPVIIDPSVAIKMSGSGMSTYVSRNIFADTGNHGGETNLTMGYAHATYPYIYTNWYRTFIKFNFSEIEPGYIPASAQISLYQHYTGYSTNVNYSIAYVLQDWNEYTINWTNQPDATAYSKTMAGGDTNLARVSWDVSELLFLMFMGYNNFGFCIARENESTPNGYIMAYSDDSVNMATLPKLEMNLFSIAQYFSKSSSTDTYVSRANPDTNYNTSTVLKLGLDGSTTCRVYVNFTLPNLSPSTKVIDAYLVQTSTAYTTAETMTLTAHKITGDWLGSTVTYNNQPTFDSNPIDTIYLGGRLGRFAFNVKSLVQDWIDNPGSNKGIVIKVKDELVATNQLYNLSASTYKPALIVSYTNDTATQVIGAMEDTYVHQGNPTTNYNEKGLKFGGSSASNQFWSFIKMDLGAMPAGAIIQSAELWVYEYGASTSNSIIAAVYEVQSAWDETTLTWNGAQSLTINPTIEAQNAISNAEVGHNIKWNITTLVQKWYTNPTLNYGVVIRCADTPDNIISSNDSECSVPMFKPFLYITYLNLGDTTPPTTTATVTSGTLGNNGWYTSDVVVSLSATDSGSGVQSISYGDGSIDTTVNGDTATITLTSEGQHTLLFQSKDNAGNVESVKQVVIKIDKSAPTNIVIDEIWYDNAENWYNTSTTAYFNNKDSLRTFRISVSYTDTVSGTSTVSGSTAFGDTPEDAWGTDGFILEYTIEQGTTPISDTTITVTVYDKAGHSASHAVPMTFKQDITPPSGYEINAPEVIGTGTAYTVSISGGSDAGSGLGNYYLDEFSSDSGEPTTVRNSMDGVTTAGTHYYRGYAKDLVGNKGTIVSATTIVGNSIPSVSDVIEVSGGEALYYNASAKKLYYSNRIASSFTINIDVTGSGAGFDTASGSSAFGDTPSDNTPGSSPAVFQLTYTIEQGAEFNGNIIITLTKGSNTQTLELAVELDNTPPSGILITSPTVPTEAYTVTIGNASDAGSGLDYYLLDKFTIPTGEPTTQRTSMTDNVNTEGTFYYLGTAVDKVGNKGEIVQKVVYVDFTSPTVSITSVSAGADAPLNVTSGTQWTVRYSNRVAFNFDITIHAADSGSGLQNVSGSNAFGDSPSTQCNGAASGDYTLTYSVEAEATASSITITVTDRAGKSATATLTLVLDNTAPPTITIEAKRLGDKVELTWTPPTDPSGVVKYVIYRGTSETDMTLLAEVSSSQDANSAKDGFQYVDNNAPSSKVYYKVVAVDSVGNSAPVSSAPAKKVNPVAQTTTEFPWLVVILGIVVAVVIVVLLLFMFRKRPTPVQHSTVQSNYPQQPQQNYQQHNFQQFPSQPVSTQMQPQVASMPAPQPSQQTTVQQTQPQNIQGQSASVQPPVQNATQTQSSPIAPVMADKTVVCNICKGIVKKGLMVIMCTCGYSFHETCALRIKTCPKCGKAIA